MNPAIKYDSRFVTLLEVISCGNFSLAASKLSLTPSAVLQQIRSLEDELDTKLFTKEGKQLIPTKECAIIAEYTRRIETLCGRMLNDISLSKLNMKHLVIGVTASVENSSLTRLLSKDLQSTENTQITVVSDISSTLCDMLEASAIDIAIVDSEMPGNKFNSILLDTDRLIVAAPRNSRYAHCGVITPGQLKSERLILRPRGSGTRNLFEANLKSSGDSIDNFKILMEIDNVATIKHLVSAGYGMSILSSRVCEKDVERGQIAELILCDLNMYRSIKIYYRKNFTNMSLLQKIQKLYNDMKNDEE